MNDLIAQRPDAVVAANDEMAMGAMRTIELAGLNVPDDIALVGFDGTSDLWNLEPSLTSMAQPFAAMAELAVSALVQAIAGEVPARHQFVIPELVLGRSSQRPRGSSP
jgi:LacI family transcriptional regulator